MVEAETSIKAFKSMVRRFEKYDDELDVSLSSGDMVSSKKILTSMVDLKYDLMDKRDVIVDHLK